MSELGVHALERSGDIQGLLERATAKVCDALRIDLCGVLEHSPRRQDLALRAGSGWKREAVGSARAGATERSPLGVALHVGEPVIIERLAQDPRFDPEPLLVQSGAVSGLVVPVKGVKGPFGVLAAYSTFSRRFVRHDASFLQSVANVIANAVRNERTMRRLRENERRLTLALESAEMGMWEVNPATGEAVWNKREYELLGLEPGQPAHSELFWERVHADDAEWLRAAVTSTLQFGETFDVEFRIVLPGGEVRWLAGRAVVVRDDQGQPIRLLGVNNDITHRKRAEEALVSSEDRYRSICEEMESIYRTAPIGLAVLDCDLRFLRLNDTLAKITGRGPSAHIGRRAHEILPGLENVADRLRRAVDAATPLLNVELEGAPGSQGEARNWLCSFVPLTGPSGRVESISCVMQDISERKGVERHQELLLAELSHRVKNMLSTVLSIASRTIRRTQDLDQFQEAFEGRILALSRAHDLITRVQWGAIDLRRLAAEILDPYVEHERKCSLEGPPLQLPPKVAVSLTMVLHELTTNAAKYGCLSQPTGHVALRWELEVENGERLLILDWQEHDGPTVSAPDEEGLGSQIIRSTVEYELSGSASIRYERDGVRCRLRLPWKDRSEDPRKSPAQA